jgi:hypothetical protein
MLCVVEFLLDHRATVLTTNCLLTCKEVSVRRRELAKPASLRPMNGFQDTSGLVARTGNVEAHARQVCQPAGQPPPASKDRSRGRGPVKRGARPLIALSSTRTI